MPTTSRNPASNCICERIHLTVGNVWRTLIHSEPPRTLNVAKTVIDSELAPTSHALRTNVSQVTGYSPGALAFRRDMILDIPLVIDVLQKRNKRQISIDGNLARINAKRRSYDYKPRQRIC